MKESATDHRMVRTHLRRAFHASMPVPLETEPHVAGALIDTLDHPGSMVRAELAYRIACSLGLASERAENLAISIEFFHTASLLFDDLPAMDDARVRRGVPCVHHVYGEGAAMLAALALINRAYALMWKSVAGLAPEVQSGALDYLERYLGIAGLLNGQGHDLYYGQIPRSARDPQSVAMGKTVSLIRLSLVLPALAARTDPRDVRLLDRLAVFWGLSYQTLDDLKDVLHSEGSYGKTGARDAQLDRPNLALSIGVREALDRIDRLMALGSRVIERLVARHERLGFLNEVRAQFDREIRHLTEVRLTRAS